MNTRIMMSAFALFLGLFLTAATESNAQIFTTPCQTYPVVASNCVGACGNPSSISYTIPPLCASLVQNLCVTREGSNLCAGYVAKAYVYVGGTLVASGDITAAGSSISFTALCGQTVTVKVIAVDTGSPVCIQLGDLKYALRLQ